MTPNPTTHTPPPPIYLKNLGIFLFSDCLRDRLKDIRATLEISPFFKCPRGRCQAFVLRGGDLCCVWWAMTSGVPA